MKYQLPNGTVLTYAIDSRFVNMLLNGENRVEKSYGVYSPGGSPRYHYGIDVDTTGSDWRVFSTVSGKVVMSTIVTNKSDKTWEWGHFVCILDGSGYRHYFCHLASRSVSVGQVVKAGDMIGVMGKTGNAANDAQAEHVHYEVRKSPYSNLASVNPTPWCGIPNKQGQTVGASLVTLKIGPVSAGDEKTMKSLAEVLELAVGQYTTLTVGPMTKGDQNTLEVKAKGLGLAVSTAEKKENSITFYTLTIGPMSGGDTVTIQGIADALLLPTEGMATLTIGPMSSGDVKTIKIKAEELKLKISEA